MLTAGYAVYRAWLEAGGAAAGASSRDTAWANTPRSSRPARRVSRMRCRSCVSARRRCRKPCRSAPAPWRRSSGSTTTRCARRAREAAQGEVVEPVNFNAPEPGGHRRATRARSSARHAAAKAGGREARGHAAGERAVSLLAAASRRPNGSPNDWRESTFAGAAIPGREQRRCGEHRRARRDQGGARAAGVPARCAGSRSIQRDRAAGRDASRRVRPGQGARGPDAAHRRRSKALRDHRSARARTRIAARGARQ